MPQAYTAPSQVSNTDYLRFNQTPDYTAYPDASNFNMNSYGGNAALSQAPYDQSIPAASTQLARRPGNRQLVSTGQRQGYDNTADSWGQFGEDPSLDPNAAAMEETDSIEALEERATTAKREAQAKRKQIPPFVQKLSR